MKLRWEILVSFALVSAPARVIRGKGLGPRLALLIWLVYAFKLHCKGYIWFCK